MPLGYLCSVWVMASSWVFMRLTIHRIETIFQLWRAGQNQASRKSGSWKIWYIWFFHIVATTASFLTLFIVFGDSCFLSPVELFVSGIGEMNHRQLSLGYHLIFTCLNHDIVIVSKPSWLSTTKWMSVHYKVDECTQPNRPMACGFPHDLTPTQ